MRAYFATKLSPNISKMPNGFLICKNVPIARTGEQEYLGSEIGLEDERKDQLVSVTREESEVFSPETLASFEGAIFVDEHPSGEVDTQNVQYLQRGFVKDVRRGEGEDADKILADIIVTDSVTISEILENGKREISCGYKCTYEEADGKIYQREIRGNHVALVDAGRAGKNVAIKDSKPQTNRKEKFFMKKKDTNGATHKSFLSKFLGVIAQDADPDVVGEIVEELVSNQSTGADEEPAPDPTPEPASEKKEETKDDEISQRFDKLEAAVNKLAAAIAGKDEDPLDALEKEVGGEEAAEKPVDEIDEGEAAGEGEETSNDDGAVLDEAEEASDEECADENAEGEEAPKSEAKDKAALRKAISDAKKAVAGIEDPVQRKTVSDSFARIIRQTYGVRSTTPKSSYSAITAIKRTKAKAADSQSQEINIEARQKAYDARNPHLNKK